MTMPEQIVTVIHYFWVAVIVLWNISAFMVKQTEHSRSEATARGAVWIVSLAWVLLFIPAFASLGWRFVPSNTATVSSGLALTVLGFALAVWARFTIGRNWSAMVTVTKDHQLVRQGPYRIVRHPIYAGFMLATLGTAVAHGTMQGLVAFAMVVLAWGYKSRIEESLMLERFGVEYEQYRREVKALLPLVW
jgi:protein-S-isoprenylcysteine O-methyltransferase Ste14